MIYARESICGSRTHRHRLSLIRIDARQTPQRHYSVWVTGNLRVTKNISAVQTCCSSDRRFKKCILPISNALARLQRLQGVTYEWDRAAYPNHGFSDGSQIGLIAQDVEQVVPEVVTTDPEGYKSLSYDKLTAVLIEAVKDQQKTINSQQAKIEEMMQRMDRLENRSEN